MAFPQCAGRSRRQQSGHQVSRTARQSAGAHRPHLGTLCGSPAGRRRARTRRRPRTRTRARAAAPPGATLAGASAPGFRAPWRFLACALAIKALGLQRTPPCVASPSPRFLGSLCLDGRSSLVAQVQLVSRGSQASKVRRQVFAHLFKACWSCPRRCLLFLGRTAAF